MKKVLYGTTALVAASLAGTGIAAAKLDVSVGGYYQAVFLAGSHDDNGATEYRNTQVKQEGEIFFNAKTTLDNGLTVGMQVQLEAYTTGDQIDEHYVYLDGGWGRVLLGAENSAPYLMHYGAQSVVPGHGVDTPNFRHHPIRGSNSSTTYLVSTSDANKVTYFTPRLGGFQLGVSYTPDTGSGLGGSSDSYTVLVADNNLEDVFEVGANYVQDFGNFNVALSGGFMTGDNNGTAAGESGWSAGLRVGFAGFTAGVAYRDVEQTSTNDEQTLSASLWYGTGPWAIGVAYLTSEYEDAAGDDEYDAYELGISYKLGAGVTAGFALQHYQSEDGATGNDGDSTVGALVLGLSF